MVRGAMAVVALLACAGAATAQPMIDGTRDQGYGSALAVQNTPTQFGDSNLGQIDFANGSELDGAYGVVRGDTLYLILTGNLESNFNKLELFFDTIPGGQNQLRGDNPDVDFNGLNRMQNMRFDAGFEADYYMMLTGGDVGNGNHDLFANWAELLTNGGGTGRYLGQGEAGSDGTLNGGDNPGVRVTLNNSNTAGVTGDSADGAADVMTGMEWAIPLAALGSPQDGDFIRVTAFINGSGHDFASNQFLGGLGGGGNLGEPGNIDLSGIAGDQFFSILVPAPGAAAMLGLGGLAITRRKR